MRFGAGLGLKRIIIDFGLFFVPNDLLCLIPKVITPFVLTVFQHMSMAFLKATTSRQFHHLRSEAAQMMMVDPMMILAGDYLAKDAGSFQGCLEICRSCS